MIAMKHPYYVQRKSGSVALNDDYTQIGKLSKRHVLKTKMIIINNPHNPTGKILSESDFEALETYWKKYPEIVLLSDEVYEYITFEAYFSSYSKKLLNRSVMVSSFGKSFHVTGWKWAI
jgi:methionine aminotransferase